MSQEHFAGDGTAHIGYSEYRVREIDRLLENMAQGDVLTVRFGICGVTTTPPFLTRTPLLTLTAAELRQVRDVLNG